MHDEPLRVPPQNLDAERSVLGAVLLINDAIDQIDLRPEDFYSDAHQKIYRSIVSLRADGVRGIDGVTLAEDLMRRGWLEEVGGGGYVGEVLESVPHAEHVRYYAQIVREKSVLRRLIYVGIDLTANCYDSPEGSQALLSKVLDEIQQIGQETAGDLLSAREMVERYKASREEEVVPVSTGLPDVDKKLKGGMKPGKYIVAAARPGTGKSAFADRILRTPAEQGEPTLLISLEMDDLEWTERVASRGEKALNDFGDLPVYMEQTKFSLDQICATIRMAKRKLGITVCVIDYLQLIEGPGKSYDRISDASRAMPRLAKELRIPIVVLAQLNRDADKRDGKRPKLADLAGSGGIEQDADIVIFLHRPSMHEKTDKPGVCELVFRKHRGGPQGVVDVGFDEEKTLFVPYEDRPMQIADGYFEGEDQNAVPYKKDEDAPF